MMIHPFYNYDPTDPTDPMAFYSDMLPENATRKDCNVLHRLLQKFLWRLIVACFVLLAVFFMSGMFTSCATKRIVSSDTTERHTHEMLQQMDSLLRSKTVVQQDSAWHQEILRQFLSIREKSDTSHFVVQDTAGNVIREKIVINNTREVTSETEREAITRMASRLEVMDLTVQAQSLTIHRMDSLLHEKHQTVEHEVGKQLSWFQQLRIWLGNIVLVALAVCAVWVIVKKKRSWLSILRKLKQHLS